jgi:heme A synthase
MRAAILFGLLTLEGVLGVATLQAVEQPVVLSIVHQALAIAVLVAALMQISPRRKARGRQRAAGGLFAKWRAADVLRTPPSPAAP